MGGLAAAKRGECDVAGIHLMNAASGEYNRPFLTDTLELVPGYRRQMHQARPRAPASGLVALSMGQSCR